MAHIYTGFDEDEYGEESISLPTKARLCCMAVASSNIVASIVAGEDCAVVVLQQVGGSKMGTVLEPLQGPLPYDLLAAEGMAFNPAGDQLLIHNDTFVVIVDVPSLHAGTRWESHYPVR